ncbi:MAG: hypothetical protein HOP29_05835 [Phycisphaerales bacterium]|nr:hypothetical protein [Phycisphaerales bacterium]
MTELLFALAGFVGGAFLAFTVLEGSRAGRRQRLRELGLKAMEIQENLERSEARKRKQDEDWERFNATQAQFLKAVGSFQQMEREADQLDIRKREFDVRVREFEKQVEARDTAIGRRAQEVENHSHEVNANLERRSTEFALREDALSLAKAEFARRVVSYDELHQENIILKRDLQNVDVNLRKLQLDHDIREEEQHRIGARSSELADRYLNDTVKWIDSSITPNNFASSKQRLIKTIEWCREIGFGIGEADEARMLANLKAEFERAVRAAFEREEQARIKAQIREEMKREDEIKRELERLDRERVAIRAALEKALREAKDEHSAEVERLRGRLTEAEGRHERAISQAQLTKSGHVYVISNIGSFGDGVFKIGMSRRLEPEERVRELSGAAVPFPYDVHMMISCDDAPSLENALHRALHKLRMNKVNPRKEFFRADIESIRAIVEANHGEVQYTADAEALQYRDTMQISDEDAEYVERIYDELDEPEEDAIAED